MRLLIKFPTRGRPERALAALDIHRAMLSGRHAVRFVVTLDDDDASMRTRTVRRALRAMPNVRVYWGRHENKVEAVNADVTWPPDWDVLLVTSDDMVPVVPGYDAVICADMREHFPDLDGVLWYNDGFVGHRICTIPIMGVRYYSRTRCVYSPGYEGLFCDNEATAVAERLGKQVYFDRTILRHDHPGNVGGSHDETYKRGSASHWRDKSLYELRASRDFDLGGPTA